MVYLKGLKSIIAMKNSNLTLRWKTCFKKIKFNRILLDKNNDIYRYRSTDLTNIMFNMNNIYEPEEYRIKIIYMVE